MPKDKFKDVIDKLWPKTKKELEKAIENTKELINKGEKRLKVVSEKSINHTKKLSLGLKKEKLYYNLGKEAAYLSKSKWANNKKIGELISEIKGIDREIKKLK